MEASMTCIIRLLVLALALAAPAWALGEPVKTDPAKGALFINMTSDDSWRGWMGLHFADNTLRQGHAVTVFLNLEAVKLAALRGEQGKKPSMKRLPRDILADFIKNGGVVLMCGPCMQEFGLTLKDLVPGVQMGKPGLTQSYIFAPNTRTLSW
jgi:predicted peroxiredoxin